MTVAEGLVVLLVEDHEFQRGMVARMVRSMGALDVIEAGNGKDALALIRGSTPYISCFSMFEALAMTGFVARAFRT